MHCNVSCCAGRAGIDADPGDEVVDGAGNRINRNASDFRPVCAVGGSAEDQVIGGAVGAEAAVFPYNIDVACAIDGSRR